MEKLFSARFLIKFKNEISEGGGRVQHEGI